MFATTTRVLRPVCVLLGGSGKSTSMTALTTRRLPALMLPGNPSQSMGSLAVFHSRERLVA